VSQTLYTIFMALLALERVFELALSRRNAAWACAHGGIEYGRSHLGWMKLLHAAWFVGCIAEVWLLDRSFQPWLGGSMLALVAFAQGLRYWAIHSLGRRWNIAVIVMPQASEAGGPYRWLRHPNYLAVVIEGFAVPLVHSAFVTALAFSALNAWLLRVRITCEEAALSRHSDYLRDFQQRPRFFPDLVRRR
jgi:methyltransferase